MGYDMSERDEVLTLLQLDEGMRILGVKFGPFDRSTGIPHSTYDEDTPFQPQMKGKQPPSERLKLYHYKCFDPTISEGDIVVVQVGYFYGVATVMTIHNGVPPAALGVKLKYVISRIDTSEGERRNAAEARFQESLARSEAKERLVRLAQNLGMDLNELRHLTRPDYATYQPIPGDAIYTGKPDHGYRSRPAQWHDDMPAPSAPDRVEIEDAVIDDLDMHNPHGYTPKP